MASVIKNSLRRLEVKHDGEVYADRPPTKWGNRDIYPVPTDQRRFTITSYFSFWVITSMSVTGWGYGGSILALGLTVPEGIGCAIVASICVGLFAYLCGHAGATKHLGFTAMARTTFGLWGCYLPVLLLVFENVVFFGVHGYFGGVAATVVIGALIPGFKDMKNTLPESAAIETNVLIGYVIYNVVFFLLLLIHPSKMRKLVWPAACVVAVVFFGLFGWAISANRGSPGKLLTSGKPLSATARSWAMLYAITAAAGSSTAYATRISDWTRFSKSKNAPVLPLLIGSPIFGSLAAILGILATDAVHARYKVLLWNPLALLVYLQEAHYTPACRAATFFAGLGLFCGLIMNNLMGKILSAGMDTAGLFPKYITTRRGSYILSIIGVLIQPWRFVNQSTTFLSVLSAFGVFVAPLTGILVADYWLIRQRKWCIPDIFEEDGIYWFTWGVNWRAIGAFFISFVFSMPGFIASVKNHTIGLGWTHMYQLCYFGNIAIAFAVFYGLSLLFPPAGRGVSKPWEDTRPVDMAQSGDPGAPTLEIVLEKTEEHLTHVEHLPNSIAV